MSTITFAGSVPAARTRRPLGLRTVLALAGLGTIAAAACLFSTALALASQGEGMAFTVPMFTVAAGLAAWNWKARGRAAAIVAGVGGLACVGVIAPGMYTLGEPESFFDFAPMAWAVAGSLVAMAGGMAGIAGRGSEAAEAGRALKLAGGLAAGLVVLGAASGAATLASRTSVSEEESAGTVAFTMADVKFREPEVPARAGETTRVLVTNTDPVIHNFTIEALGIDVKVGPGSERVIEIPAEAAGRFTITCSVSGHEKMKSMLVVE